MADTVLRILSSLFACSAALLAAGCDNSKTPSQPSDLPVRYESAQCGLTFFLPATWQGYTVLTEQWDAPLRSVDYKSEIGREHGPIIILRRPQDGPWQDIPVMVFTHRQWVAQQQDRCFPYAGGVIDELWHNRNYVFGLYSRALWQEEQGLEEAQDIIKRNHAANPMPELYEREGYHSKEHDWRLVVGGYDFGLVQQALYVDNTQNRLIRRETTICVGRFGETTTRLRAPLIALAWLLLPGVGATLLVRALWTGRR
jgi:hypothetical protein